MELVQAARNGNVAEVRRQAVLGADVNVEDDVGWRPLHHAALYGHVEVMRALAELERMSTQKMLTDRGHSTSQHSSGTWRR
jgi:ankyrin repeat protein